MRTRIKICGVTDPDTAREAVEWAGALLASRDRTRAGATAPAAGLYFTGVKYARRFALPPPPDPCRFW